MKRKLWSGLAVVALTVGLITAFVAQPASAYSSPFPATDSACDRVEAVEYTVSLATNGFGVAWAYSGQITPYHATSLCVRTGVWNESVITSEVTIDRYVWPGVWANCYDFLPAPHAGITTISGARVGGSDFCSSVNWPQGATRVCLTASAWHDGAQVSTGDRQCTYDSA